MIRWTAALAALLLCACENDGGEGGSGTFTETGSATPGKTGFSADLAKELGGSGDGKEKVAAATDGKKGDGSDPKGDAKAETDAKDAKGDGKDAKDPKAETSDAKDPKAETSDAKDPKADAKDMKADAKDAKGDGKDANGDAKDPKADAKDMKADAKDTKGDGKDAKDMKADAKDMKADAKDTKADGKDAKDAKDPKADAKDMKADAKDAKDPKTDAKADGKDAKDAKTEVKVEAKAPPEPTGPRVQLRPPADLAAMKLSLLPNWDRDVGEVGTISFEMKVPGKTERKIFVFRYGYESDKAPTDRDAYKKWLEKEGILRDIKDRQRGGAWLLEGLDATGSPSFRFVVLYSKRLLLCYGSTYRDAASNALGDLRDQTIIQAKQICETLTL
ncbi:MAG: hypothetical protein KF773_00925 [Deltaproteobacteria bacterium]|nr:hypothetical protein [Deltaproteobacteria bacterium]